MDYVLLSDLLRYWTVIVALWIIAILVRLAIVRFREKGWRCILRQQEHPHVLTTLGLAVLMLVAILRRFENLGEPADGYLWLVTSGVHLVLAGVLINLHFDLRPPWRRHNAP